MHPHHWNCNYHPPPHWNHHQNWHKRCFTCGSCNRYLDSTTVNDGPDGEIYCRGCHRCLTNGYWPCWWCRWYIHFIKLGIRQPTAAKTLAGSWGGDQSGRINSSHSVIQEFACLDWMGLPVGDQTCHNDFPTCQNNFCTSQKKIVTFSWHTDRKLFCQVGNYFGRSGHHPTIQSSPSAWIPDTKKEPEEKSYS